MKNIDVDGDSVRVYTETTSNYGLGHTWISTGEGENMVVYSYGRYDGTNKDVYKRQDWDNGVALDNECGLYGK